MEAKLTKARLVLLLALFGPDACHAGERDREKNSPLPSVDFTRKLNDSIPRGTRPGDRAGIIEGFKIAKDGGLIVIPVTIQNKPYRFVLDSGSSTSVYDVTFRSLLGAPIKSEKIWTPGGNMKVDVYRSPKVAVGKLKMSDKSDCFCVDMENMREVSGEEIYGCLGMDFLRKHVVRIDFDRGEVVFLRAAGQYSGLRIPIVFRGTDPYVLLKVRGFHLPAHFLVDTGDVGSGNMEHVEFDCLARWGFLQLIGHTPMLSATGFGRTRFGIVESINLEGFCHERIVFRESNRNGLGLGYLSRYVVTFDFPNRVLYLKKGRNFARPELNDRSGLDIRRRKGRTVVESVIEGSSSARAGLKQNDILLKIDGINVSDISLYKVHRLFAQKDNSYHLLIRRGDKELKMKMSLQEVEKKRGGEKKGEKRAPEIFD